MLKIEAVVVAAITVILLGFTVPAMAVEETTGGYASYSW
jgi:hypothetical protein